MVRSAQSRVSENAKAALIACAAIVIALGVVLAAAGDEPSRSIVMASGVDEVVAPGGTAEADAHDGVTHDGAGGHAHDGDAAHAHDSRTGDADGAHVHTGAEQTADHSHAATQDANHAHPDGATSNAGGHTHPGGSAGGGTSDDGHTHPGSTGGGGTGSGGTGSGGTGGGHTHPGGGGGHDHPDVPNAQLADLDPSIQAQITSVRDWALQFPTAAQASAAGWRKSTRYFPGIAAHYLNSGLLDSTFDPARPEVLLYDGNGPNAKLVGINYIVYNGATPPQGFPGSGDGWHAHPSLCQVNGIVVGGEETTAERCAAQGGELIDFSGYWLLHVWCIPDWESPEGIFSHANSKLT